ncbi:hypothetical protein L6164_016719 [Bauhinia variegata]|uniref:Uncharacterized protein n=1 Tax=Bauhinia variegata TaxID=167791 RepID=A0ACB9N613_BAUVA|nr:hypothetical protein L6164_016719 [Bauhinia variegata]
MMVLASYSSTESVSFTIPEISVSALLLCFLAEISLVPRPAMASLIESGWQYLITHFSDFQLACLGIFFLHESVFFLSGLPFIWIERAGWLSKYKIQAKINSQAQEKCILSLVLYHVGVNLPLMIFSYPVFRYMGMQSSLPLPSWKIVLSQIIFYFILEDFVFYWGHRILHTKWLYKHAHSFHHESDFHDYHHRLLYTKSGNYSSTFTYMDWIFGTDIGYRKLKELKNAAVEDSSEQKKQW